MSRWTKVKIVFPNTSVISFAKLVIKLCEKYVLVFAAEVSCNTDGKDNRCVYIQTNRNSKMSHRVIEELSSSIIGYSVYASKFTQIVGQIMSSYGTLGLHGGSRKGSGRKRNPDNKNSRGEIVIGVLPLGEESIEHIEVEDVRTIVTTYPYIDRLDMIIEFGKLIYDNPRNSNIIVLKKSSVFSFFNGRIWEQRIIRNDFSEILYTVWNKHLLQFINDNSGCIKESTLNLARSIIESVDKKKKVYPDEFNKEMICMGKNIMEDVSEEINALQRRSGKKVRRS